MSDEPINWEAIAKERLDAIVQFKTRAEAAEAKVKVMEEALRRIASKTTDPYADSEALTALAAKEKP